MDDSEEFALKTQDIKDRLASCAFEVCQHLYPHGKRMSNNWCLGSLQGEPGASLRICFEGEKTGIWYDFATDDGSNNLLELWRLARGLSFVDARTEAASWLGMSLEAPRSPGAGLSRPPAMSKPSKPAPPPQRKWDALSRDCSEYLQDRGIDKSTLEKFGIGTKMGKTGEVIVFPYEAADGTLEMIKYIGLDRPDGKKQVATNKGAKKVLFGKRQFPKSINILTISEGEIDAMSLSQAGIAAVSVPFGAKSTTATGSNPNDEWIEHDYEWLERFEEIVLAFDNDESGEAAVKGLIDRLGRIRCSVAKPPGDCKDWNEAVSSGHDVTEAWASRSPCDPPSLQRPDELIDDVLEELYPTTTARLGLTNPLLKELPIRPTEVTLYTGINGHGKSEYLLQILTLLGLQGAKCCLASLEIPTTKSLARMLKQASGTGSPPPEAVRQIATDMRAWMLFYNHVGESDVETLLEDFEYAYRRYGTTQFVIDSLLKLGIDEDDFTKQRQCVAALMSFVMKFPETHIHFVAHPRKVESENRMPDKLAVAGSGHLTNLVSNVVIIWRNKEKEALVQQRIDDGEDERNVLHELKDTPNTRVKVVKNRDAGIEPEVGLLYRPDCCSFLPAGSNPYGSLMDLVRIAANLSQEQQATATRNRDFRK